MGLTIPVPQGVAPEKRVLDFILLCDTSGSMAGDKIASLNEAINPVIQTLKNDASNHQIQIMIRCIAFDSSARWHIAQPTPLDQFQWNPLQASGYTRMGEALSMLSDIVPSMVTGQRKIVPPCFLLLSDGQPNDDFEGGLKKLNDQIKSAGIKKTIRMAIAIGNDADQDILRKFVGDTEGPVLDVHNKEQFIHAMIWASRSLVSASIPKSPSPSPASPPPAQAAGPSGTWDW